MQTFTFGNYKYGMFRTTGVNVSVDLVYVSTELYVVCIVQCIELISIKVSNSDKCSL